MEAYRLLTHGPSRANLYTLRLRASCVCERPSDHEQPLLMQPLLMKHIAFQLLQVPCAWPVLRPLALSHPIAASFVPHLPFLSCLTLCQSGHGPLPSQPHPLKPGVCCVGYESLGVHSLQTAHAHSMLRTHGAMRGHHPRHGVLLLRRRRLDMPASRSPLASKPLGIAVQGAASSVPTRVATAAASDLRYEAARASSVATWRV